MLKNVANAEQARSWDGDDGDHWTDYVETYDACYEPYTICMREIAAISPDERVLDIGCGCGETTIDAARAASNGWAHGIDLSSRMLEYARHRAEAAGVKNIRFEQVDAQVHPFDAGAYDIAISRTGGMFFSDPVAAYANIARALRPGGRLLLMTWQGIEKNEWLREIQSAFAAGREMPAPPPGAPHPLSLSDPGRVRDVLGGAGFTDIGLEAVDRPFRMGADAADAYAFMSSSGISRGMLGEADAATRERALANLRATLTAHDTGNGVIYKSGAWMITATRP